MSRFVIVEGNNNDKDNVRAIMVKGEKGDKGDNGEITYSDVIDNLTSTEAQKPLSANQGKQLKDLIDNNTDDIEKLTTKANKTPYYFNTVADMKAYNLADGDFAITLGYYTVNDGGGSSYNIVDDNTLTDDGGSIIDLTNGLKAKLIINDFINVKQFGAYGDNTHDDTSAIQNALNLNKDIYIPIGRYLLESSITITNKEHWKMDGSNAIFNYTGDSYAFYLSKLRYSDINLNNIIANYGGCINLSGNSSSLYTQYLNIEFSELSAFTDCIHVENSGNCWISEVRLSKGRFHTGNNGLYILMDSTSGLSHWVFNEVGVEGVSVGFNFNTTQNAETNGHGIDNFEFFGCRMDEATTLFKNTGLVNKLLWNGANRILERQLDLTEKAKYWKLIASDMTIYIYNGAYHQHAINKNNDIEWQGVFVDDSSRFYITDEIATVNLVFSATEETTLGHNTLVATGLPRPKENIYFMAQNYNKDEAMPRFYVDTYGNLFSAWSTGKKVYTSGTPCIANISYPIQSMDKYSS